MRGKGALRREALLRLQEESPEPRNDEDRVINEMTLVSKKEA